MKRLQLLTLAVFLVFAQWADLEHGYHEHKPGEVCDYCLSAQPLGHAVTSSIHLFAPLWSAETIVESNVLVSRRTFTPNYCSRAPPRFI